MNEEGRAYRDELTLKSLVRKFEDMVEQGDQAFFDVDELEGLIEHYLEHKSQRKAQSVLRYACQLYPGNLTLKLRQSQIWVAIGQPVKAVPLLKELLEIEPHSEEILATLLNVHIVGGTKDLAEHLQDGFHAEQPHAMLREHVSPESIILVSTENDNTFESLGLHGVVEQRGSQHALARSTGPYDDVDGWLTEVHLKARFGRDAIVLHFCISSIL